ncbi:SDR family oxidoreductase [Actinocorallia sp. API 0066]|uniref:SDR family oxidoreductase n=1 Tax=Actinocorallia sp. API 0066 TaxID=2896846 RepID=UPI001E4A3E31|nr:SDR family oxidoreductase [Actinocorallia sp. API 0066]MCD0448229.1 SDR family oxidoreductase [Actinocorallia sp. API 0066]
MGRTILVTGASGVVGRSLVPEFAGHRVVGMTHADPEPHACETFTGDLAADRFGLDPDSYRNLARDVDVVVHSGARTTWGRPYDEYQRINVDGTRRVLEFAQFAGAPVHYVSTCFVYSLMLPDAPRLAPGNVVLPYITSKLAAETLLRESGHPVSIYRPTNLVGDSTTGHSSRPQIVQAVSEWVCRGRAPYFPAHPGNLVDVVPQDVLAVSVRRAVEADDLGSDYWLTYGAEAMTVEETLAICLEHAARKGRPFTPPPIVDPTRPLPVPLDEVPPMSRAYVSVLLDVSENVAACGGVLPSSLKDLESRHGVARVSDREAYRRSLSYWAGDPAPPGK